jgi:hypothetical protein
MALASCRPSNVSSEARHQPAGKGPWSARGLADDPAAFQFVVVTDRTGGARPNVFESAMDKTNLLVPEFVMSVGDLIEGYTNDRAQIDREWDEFQGFVNRLDMRFYYVPGNHDMATPELAEEWQRRFGPAYYSFVHRNVLFLCLNTDDGQKPTLSDAQVDSISSAIDQHPDVRWTLLFMHRPLWLSDEAGAGHRQFERIERKLEGRPYTVIAGHFHRYTKHIRHDRRYIILATTGGGSHLRGPMFGEFDHVAWITMKDDGPRVANLMLDGIADENIRTAADAELVEKIESGWSLGWTGNLLAGDRFTGAPLALEVKNQTPVSAELELELEESEHLRPRPRSVKLSLAAGARQTVPVEFAVGQPLPPGEVPPLRYDWHAKFGGGRPIELHEHEALPLYPALPLPRRKGSVDVDGRLDEWGTLRFQGRQALHVPKDDPAWTGFDDLDYQFSIADGENHLYVGVNVIDDRIRTERDRKPWNQDAIELLFDPREDPARANNRGDQGSGYRNFGYLSFSPAESPEQMAVEPRELIPPELSIVTRLTATGYAAEVAIPHSLLDRMHGDGSWNAVRFNLTIHDTDDNFEERSTLGWQPGWDSAENQPGSGTFRRSPR